MSLARASARVLSALLAEELKRVGAESEQLAALASAIDGSGPEPTALWATAGHLQAFYSGIEAMLARILREVDGFLPGGPDSHREVLHQSAVDLPGARPRVLDGDVVLLLAPYLAFRHFFRHAYGVVLRWEPMEDKARHAPAVLAAFADRIAAFRAFLDALGAP